MSRVKATEKRITAGGERELPERVMSSRYVDKIVDNPIDQAPDRTHTGDTSNSREWPVSNMKRQHETIQEHLDSARDNLSTAIEFFDGGYLGAAEAFAFEAMYELRQARKHQGQTQEEKSA